MRSRDIILNLDSVLAELKSYIDPSFKKGIVDNKSGGLNFVMFPENLPVKQQKDEIISKLSAVTLIPKKKYIIKDYMNAYNTLRTASSKKQHSKDSKETDIDNSLGINSPFIQTFLYQGIKGKILVKADCDLYDFLNKIINDPLYFVRVPLVDLNLKEIISQLVLAVYELHSNDLVHRDIKNENVLVTIRVDGSLYLQLSDLDTVVRSDEKNLQLIGTRWNFSPELFSGDKLIKYKIYNDLDKKAIDCYALGLMISQISKISYFKQCANLKNLINSLLDSDCQSRATLNDVVQHKFFGKTRKERASYFKSVTIKFKRPDFFYDSYYQSSKNYYPKANDAFLILPHHLKEIYVLARNLQNKLVFLINRSTYENFKVTDFMFLVN
ncbi:hypothetical protein N9L02_01470, partial [Gammaproteobacteria bacterium]|nr:hypothetical protein [Gammaproteobacteria bacterium]